MGTCERMLHIDAPAEQVWAWMSRPQNLFGVNIFHASVETDVDEISVGVVVTIDHDFFGVYRQRRQARVRQFDRYFISFGEHKCVEEAGRDPFPHNQSFRVLPVDDHSCIVINRLTGRYVFPGAKLVGERLFQRYMPVILDDDNQVIAIGCGALAPTKLRVPKGLLLWPAMALGARFVKKSTRRDMIERVKAADGGHRPQARAAISPTAS